MARSQKTRVVSETRETSIMNESEDGSSKVSEEMILTGLVVPAVRDYSGSGSTTEDSSGMPCSLS
jgi:hypothetical protein